MTLALLGCSKPSADEMFNKGVDAQKAEQYNNAINLFQELIKTYPDSARTPEAYYAIGTIYQNHLQSYNLAIETFRHLVDKYPGHATAPSAMFLIGFIYNNDLKNVDSARLSYEDFIKRYPENQLVTSAQFELSNLGKEPSEILNTQLDKEKPKPIKKLRKK